MGAEVFTVSAKAKNAAEAFDALVEQAYYEYGHAGYTGTIAEKSGYKIFTPPPEIKPQIFINLIDRYQDTPDYWKEVAVRLGKDPDDRIKKLFLDASVVYEDKWGPALCVQSGDQFIFAGWASS